jgi:nucleoside triphosphate pyrophosphatase
MRLVLASASPRRAELLRAAGFDFDVRPTDVDETPRADEAPEDYVRRLAAEKSAAAQVDRRDAIVLGADTAVVLDRVILGKPRDRAEAASMVGRLAGRRHEVMTGVSLRRDGHEVGRVETTAVWFAPMTSEDIAWYAASGEGLDKAGAYAIQGLAARFIPRIDGSYSNVVGLPISAVTELLSALASGGEEGLFLSVPFPRKSL